MRKLVFIFILFYGFGLLAQEPILIPASEKPPYDRKEEILHDGKRYRKYNGYLNLGPMFLNSSLRKGGQQGVFMDFHFHIRREYFQIGAAISGDKLLENNHSQGRLGYGYRKETAKYNFAMFAGPTIFYGVQGVEDSTNYFHPEFYSGVGAYACAQIATKLAYDIGIGAELFGDINYKQKVVGIKIFLFFSGSYRGVKRNFNPHVRTEQKK